MSIISDLAQLLHILRVRWQAGEKRVAVTGLSDALKQLFALKLSHEAASKLVVVLPRSRDAAAWADFLDEALGTMLDERTRACLLPYVPVWGAERYANPGILQHQRLITLWRLLDPQSRTIVVTTPAALAQTTLSPHRLRELILSLKRGEEYDQEELCERLLYLGYQKTDAVDEPGMFAVRGGIVDIFSAGQDYPARLEFFGDTIRDIRRFQVEAQRSMASMETYDVLPAREVAVPPTSRKEDAQELYNFLLTQEMDHHDREGMVNAFQDGLLFPGFHIFAPLFRRESIATMSYLGDDSILVFPQDLPGCQEHFRELHERFARDHDGDIANGKGTVPVSWHFQAPDEWRRAVEGCSTIHLADPLSTEKNMPIVFSGTRPLPEAAKPGRSEAERFDLWFNTAKRLADEGSQIAIFVRSEEQLRRLQNLFEHRKVDLAVASPLLALFLADALPAKPIMAGLGVSSGYLWFHERHLLVLPEDELFGPRRKANKPTSAKLKNFLNSFKDLKVGGLVVHVEHGVCRYLGLTTLSVGGNTADFLNLEFAGGDKLYLPVDRLSSLQRYNSGADDSRAPALDRLKGQNWEKRKGRVRERVREIAKKLLEIQAHRKLAPGNQYGAVSETYYRFEAAFPYEETPDQLRAIQEVNADLSAPHPMDRLVCGDVGFGKTEVALRAAMRAVTEGYQVMVLVPTTVLCHQHYRTFSSRLGEFGVNVIQANRFIPAKKLKVDLEDFGKGKADVLIGTHRILSKDVKPRRLGLVIIDEEQRFGVEHKETLKTLAYGCDILTLSATPIPRTLHMSLLGLKDISLITTPPKERLSIKTYVSPMDEELIRNAIEQELRRGGQVFFLHNRVEDIVEMRNRVQALVPHAEARIAHGQMPSHALETVIIDFLEQKFPILVCTSIIESGIDMPNVNTLIVNHAERFGLSQLYQIRGRVGRSRTQAYAYFIVPHEEALAGDARKRLEILASHQDLGEGFHIANYDLEMRGAGSLLGGDQSGSMAEIGVELYTDMLEAAVRELQGKLPEQLIDTEIKIPLSATIPPEYVTSESQRLALYKSLFSMLSEEELRDLTKDIVDRYGPMPASCTRLAKVAELKRILRILRAQTITQKSSGEFEIRFHSLQESEVAKIIAAAKQQSKRFKLTPDYRLSVTIQVSQEKSGDAQTDLLEGLISVLYPVATEFLVKETSA